MNQGDVFQGPSQTVIQLAGKELTITVEDAQAMKGALLAYIRNSTIEHRDYLIRMTEQVPGWIDPEGFVRIGPWLLQARDTSLVLTYRLPHGQYGGGAYVAYLERTRGGWDITKLEFERIRYER